MTKKQSITFLGIARVWWLAIVPLVLVLMAGLFVRLRVSEPIAQAKSAPEQLSADSQDLSDAFINAETSKSTVNGITFYAGNYRLDNADKLLIDFRFDQIDTGDWIINESYIVDKQGIKAYLSETDLLAIHFPPTTIDGEAKQQILDYQGGRQDVKNYYINAESDTKVGQRFVTVTYRLPPEFDLSSFSVVVENIYSLPRESELCSDIFISKMQQLLDERQMGIKIKLKTDESDGGGMCGFEIVETPKNLSVEEARSKVGNKEMMLDLYGIRGPWIFEGSMK